MDYQQITFNYLINLNVLCCCKNAEFIFSPLSVNLGLAETERRRKRGRKVKQLAVDKQTIELAECVYVREVCVWVRVGVCERGCVRVCVWVCVRVRVRVCERGRVRVRVRVRVLVCVRRRRGRLAANLIPCWNVSRSKITN